MSFIVANEAPGVPRRSAGLGNACADCHDLGKDD